MSLRVGIVGYGEIAQYHARHLAAAGARVTGIVTRRPTPPEVTRYPSLAALLRDVDAVTIAVPNALHAPLCMEAVAAKVAVFVEKPLCIDERELAALDPALRAAARPVHVGFRLRWNPALRALSTRLGGVRLVRCVYRLGIERLAVGKPWTRYEAQSGGAFCTLAVHALDVARWLGNAAARPIEDLRADAAHLEPGADFPLVVSLEGTIRDGPRVEVGADLRGDGEFRLELDIEAERGSPSDLSLAAPRPEEPGAADAEYSAMLADFVADASRGGSRPDYTAEILQCHRDLLTARALAR